ncbi:barstar family protein [Tropicibacter oceani]|uniref:Barstar family protein n=1 Tax=Tropicibacter oceani TaxID=3058420 RepID=A0ABY8QLZ0_9RHOB|nr:barstar family protein [Tropicibacter oceani]WGW05473.1 barstar family protein [Tropicibacter oceani]
MSNETWKKYQNMETYRIDGERFSTLEEFYEEISRVLIPNVSWGHNLDAFNDILRGGFGTPDEGFILIWENSALSKKRLGYPETVRILERRLDRCHPTAHRSVKRQLRDAGNNKGATVFVWLVEVIRAHGEGGEEAEDNVILKLS